MKTFEASVQKEAKETKLGIVLLQTAGTEEILIKSIKPDSLISSTDLVPGLQVLSINGQDLTALNASEAAKLLGAAEGEVKITAQGTVATVTKGHFDDKVGISLQKHKDVVRIVKLSANGLLSRTDLEVGQRLTCINGEACPKESKDATQKIKDCPDEITLVAIDTDGPSVSSPQGEPGSFAAAFATEEPSTSSLVETPVPSAPRPKEGKMVIAYASKPTMDTSVGISLGRNSQLKAIVITKISETSLFKDTNLKVGQKVISINGTPCPDTTKEAVQLIKNSEGDVTIAAVNFATEVKSEPEKAPPPEAFAAVGAAAAAAAEPAKDEAAEKENEAPQKEEEPAKAAEEAIKPVVAKTLPILTEGQVIAKVTKATKEEKVGIRMKDRGGGVVISQIVESGPFAGSDLIPGMKVHLVNGNPCPGSAYECVELIKSCSGDITIVAGTTVATATKESKDSKLGVSFGKHKNGAVVLVANSGLFARSDLKLGMKIVSVNDQTCPGGVKEAIDLLKEAEGTVKLVAVENMAAVKSSKRALEEAPKIEPAVGHVTASGKKEEGGSFGISMQSGDKAARGVYISKIDPEGAFAGTDLRVGQKVISINGEACPATALSAIKMITDSGNEVTLVASNTVSTVKKTDKDAKLGITLGQMEGYVIVYKIAGDSIFKNSKVRVGQTVLSINGQDCPDTVKDAAAMLTGAESEVTIVTVKTITHAAPMFPEDSWVTETRTKADSSEPFGIYMLSKGMKSQRVVISKIAPGSPFADSKLMVGQTVISINGKACPMFAQDAIDMIKDAGDEVTITAASLIATVRKPEKDSKVGISLGQENGYVAVRKIGKNSLFASTYLRVGQKVVSINDQEFDNNIPKAATLLREADGLVTVKAVDVVERKSYGVPADEGEGQITVTVSKESKDSSIGMSAYRSHQGHIIVSRIKEGGPLADSGLMVGQRIVSINGTPCTGLVKDAITIIKEAEGDVTIVATSIVAKAEKASKGHKVGIAFKKGGDGSIIVTRVDPGCLFDLQLNQKIVSINGEECPKTVKDSIMLLRNGEGPMTIVALDTFTRTAKKEVPVTREVVVPPPEEEKADEPEPETEAAAPDTEAAESSGEKVEEDSPEPESTEAAPEDKEPAQETAVEAEAPAEPAAEEPETPAEPAAEEPAAEEPAKATVDEPEESTEPAAEKPEEPAEAASEEPEAPAETATEEPKSKEEGDTDGEPATS